MTFDQAWLAAIDQRIRADRTSVTAAGTVTERSTTGSRAMVVFDGSTVPSPVKAFGNILVHDGDRVGLVKFGGDWVIVGVFGERWSSNEVTEQFNPLVGSAAATVTGAWIDLPGSPEVTFTKVRDDTDVHCWMSCAAYRNGGNATVGLGVVWEGVELEVARTVLNIGLLHMTVTGARTLIGGSAGEHIVPLIFRRVSGANTVTIDGSHSAFITLREISP